MKKLATSRSIKTKPVLPIRKIDFLQGKHTIKMKPDQTPRLSDFLRGYIVLVKNVKSVNTAIRIHQLDIKEFNIDITTGMTGIDNQEIILAL
ncbi:hypothetical protein [Ekhidna sp.]|uniref:hypothetical protein n=1 Tax=Ekhidna sp. TaxID=2608089 RepID=UPI003297CD83